METSVTYPLLGCFTSAVQEKKPIGETELSSAYGEFINHLSSIVRSGQSVIEKLRRLRHLEVELDMYRHEAYRIPDGLADIYHMKATALVRMEIDLLHFAAEHPGCQVDAHAEGEEAVCLPSLHWKGSLANLMELIASLDYSGLVEDAAGNRQSFAGLVAAFEKLFHVSLPKPYDLRADLSRRKKSLSVLLPKLKETYEKNIINCGIERR